MIKVVVIIVAKVVLLRVVKIVIGLLKLLLKWLN